MSMNMDLNEGMRYGRKTYMKMRWIFDDKINKNIPFLEIYGCIFDVLYRVGSLGNRAFKRCKNHQKAFLRSRDMKRLFLLEITSQIPRISHNILFTVSDQRMRE